MSNFTFFKAFTLLQEADAPPGGPPGGPGGPPGADPMGGMMGGPPGGGGAPGGPPGGPGGDPMGGGGPQGQPIDVKSIPVGDVWKLLEKIVKDEKKYAKFFEEINIVKKDKPTTYSQQKPEKEKRSLMR